MGRIWDSAFRPGVATPAPTHIVRKEIVVDATEELLHDEYPAFSRHEADKCLNDLCELYARKGYSVLHTTNDVAVGFAPGVNVILSIKAVG